MVKEIDQLIPELRDERNTFTERREGSRIYGTGFSQRINDYAFVSKAKRGSKYSVVYSVFFAIACVPVFIMMDTVSDKINRTGAITAGIFAAIIILAAGIFLQLRYIKKRSWEGTITNKQEEKSTQLVLKGLLLKKAEITMYVIEALEKDGKLHKIKYKDRQDIFEYFNVGDQISKHGGLKIYEKFDKTGDTCVFCSVCLTKNEPDEDFCAKCKFPLLK